MTNKCIDSVVFGSEEIVGRYTQLKIAAARETIKKVYEIDITSYGSGASWNLSSEDPLRDFIQNNAGIRPRRCDYAQTWGTEFYKQLEREKDSTFVRPHLKNLLRRMKELEITPIFLGEQEAINLMAYLDSMDFDGNSFGISKHTLKKFLGCKDPRSVLDRALVKHGKSPGSAILISDVPEDITAAKEIGMYTIGHTLGRSKLGEALLEVSPDAIVPDYRGARIVLDGLVNARQGYNGNEQRSEQQNVIA